MKYFFIILFTSFISLNTYAQTSGGQIRRHASSKTQQQTNNYQKKTIGKSGRISEEDKYNNMSIGTLEKYAEQGDIMAQFYLGYKYAQEGQYTTAITWFQNPAGRGLVRAQLWLAYCYYHGKGCDKDWTRAKLWLDAAANRGSEEAKEYLETWFK